MKHSQRTWIAWLACATLSVACTARSDSSPAATSPNLDMPSKADEPLPDTSAVPSEDEADTAAAKSITPENADAELDKLKKELDGGGN